MTDKGWAGYMYVAHAFYNNFVSTLIINYCAIHNLKKNVTRVDVDTVHSVSTWKLFYEKKKC
jgi:hypothetical protein